MISNYRLFESTQLIVRLVKFDRNHFNTIKDNDKMDLDDMIKKYNHIHTFTVNNIKGGMTGYITFGGCNYFQIAIHQDFRGKGLIKIVSDKLATTYNLDHLFATINEKNIASIKSHLAAGFKYPEKEVEDVYKKKRPPKHIGLIKYYDKTKFQLERIKRTRTMRKE